MNWDRIEGNWKQFSGKIREGWGRLTDNDITMVNAKRDQLIGRIQERQAIARDQAEKQVKTWKGKL